jgi:hypothetical protein
MFRRDSANQDTGKRPLAPSWSPDGTQIGSRESGLSTKDGGNPLN